MASNGYLGALCGHFGVTLASPWITSGTLEGHFGVTLGVFDIILGDFGVSLKSLGVHKGYCGIILARFQKTLIFSTDFSGFIKYREMTCRIERQILLMIMSIRMRFGCILGPFWMHVGSVLGPFCACQVGSNANSLRIGSKALPSRLIAKLNTFCRRIFVCHNSL